LNKEPALFYKLLAVGVIFLFIGIGIQPAFADGFIKSVNSEPVEIIVQFCEVDKTYNHTVVLTQEQLIELDILLINVRNNLAFADNQIETEAIFNKAIVSFDKLGLIPDYMSIDYAQQLVTGKEQKPWIRNVLENWLNKKNSHNSENENNCCLIVGDTENTLFAGPIPIFTAIHFFMILYRINSILDWVSSSSKFGKFLANIFMDLFDEIYRLRLFFWFILGAGINFFPIKIGALMHYGNYAYDPYGGGIIPAEGWVITLGSSGKKSWSGSFYGFIFGFTGIKIMRDYFDFFHLGSAFHAYIGY
jgi:hypothetical protein